MDNQFDRQRRRSLGVPARETYAIGGGWVGGSGNQGGGTVGGYVGSHDDSDHPYEAFDEDYRREDERLHGGRAYRPQRTSEYAPGYEPSPTYDWGESQGANEPRSRGRGGRGRYRDEGGYMGRDQRYRAYGASEGQPVGGRGEEYGRSGREGAHFDRDYLNWRQSEIDRLDAEYSEFAKERQERFRSEFETWRKSRDEARLNAAAEGDQQGSPPVNTERKS